MVEVAVDASTVAATVQRDLNKAFAGLDISAAQRAFDKVADAAKNALGQVSSQSGKATAGLDKIADVADSAGTAISRVGVEAAETGERIGHNFQAGGETAERALRELDRTAGVQFAAIAAKAEAASATVATSSSLGSFVAGLGGAVSTAATAIGVALTATTAFGLKTSASLEQTRIAFQSLLGGIDEGNAVFASLQQFAAVTPFEFGDLTGIAQKFLAFSAGVGLARDQLEPFLTVVGNVVSVTGGGAEALDSVARAFGHISSGGKVSLEDINILSDALPGFSGVAAIAAAQGLTTAEAMKQISAGTIDAVEGTADLIAGMEQFPGAAGAMDKQAQTLLGVFSTFKDVVGQALAGAFEPVIPLIKQSLSDITPILGAAVAQLAPALGGVLSSALPAVASLIQGLVPILTPVLDAISQALGAIDFKPIGEALGGLLAALGPVLPPLVQIVAVLLTGLAPALVALTPAIIALAPPLAQILTLVAAGLGPAMDGLAAAIGAVIGPLSDFLNWLMGSSQPAEALKFALVGIAAALVIYKTIMTVISVATKIWTAAQWLLNIALDANPIGLVVLAIAALVGVIVWIATKTTWFQATWEAVWSFLKTVGAWFAGPFADFFVNAYQAVINFGKAVGGAFASAWHAVLDFFVGIGHWFAELPGVIGGFLASLPGRFVAGLKATFDMALRAVGIGIGLILAVMIGLPQLIINAVVELPGLLARFFTNLWNTVVDLGARGVRGVVEHFLGFVHFLTTVPGLALQALVNFGAVIGHAISAGMDFVRDLAVQGFLNVVAFIKSVPDLAWQALANLGVVIGNAFTAAIEFAKNLAIDGFNSIVEFVKSVPDRIAALGPAMLQAGRDLIAGLMSGLGEAGEFIGDLAQRIVSSITGFLNQVIDKINIGIQDVDDFLPGVTLPQIPHIPQLATGGLTTRQGLANLHPKELVLPLESARTTDLLARAINEANNGLRSVGVPTVQTVAPEVHVYIGDKELTDMVDVQIAEGNRSLKTRVTATGRRRR